MFLAEENIDRIFLSDGTTINNVHDAIRYFNNLGIVYEHDFTSLYAMLKQIVHGEDDDEYEALVAKADEYEMIADEYKQNMDGLCDEVGAIAEHLISGKRGANYTKEALGNALLNAIRCYEI